MEKKPVVVREVWSENLESEFLLLEKAIPFHPFISVDTEFPGTVVHADQEFPISSAPPHHIYNLMKLNVNALKIIQLGIALSDASGNLPDFGTDSSYVWQFNFCDFDIKHDIYNEDSVQMLEKQGIDFSKFREDGIDSKDFGVRWITSSVMDQYRHSMTWITFHGGYDIGFLVKILRGGQDLPDRMDWFKDVVEDFIGVEVFDLKYMAYNQGIHGGLEKVANDIGVCRLTGNKHEAASDSLLTLEAFIEFMGIVFANGTAYQLLHGSCGKLYGLCSKHMQPLPPPCEPACLTCSGHALMRSRATTDFTDLVWYRG